MANAEKNQSETSKPALSRKQIKVFQAWLNSIYDGKVPHIPFSDAKSIMIEKGLTGPVELTDEACPDVLFTGRIREAVVRAIPFNFPES